MDSDSSSKMYIGVFVVVIIVVVLVVALWLWNDNNTTVIRSSRRLALATSTPSISSAKAVRVSGTPDFDYIVVVNSSLYLGGELNATSVLGVTYAGLVTAVNATPGDEYNFVSTSQIVARVTAPSAITTVTPSFNATTKILTLTLA